MKRALFIDRDGTLIVEPPDEQIDSLEKLEFIPGMFTQLGKIARSGQYDLVMVTNQDGLGTEKFPESNFYPAHNKLMTALANEGIQFREVLIDRSFAAQKLPTRKPGTGLLTSYMNGSYDLVNSYVIGDRLTDLELARNLGAKGILIGKPERMAEVATANLSSHCSLITPDWQNIYELTCQGRRSVSLDRKTRETHIQLLLNLDGTGQSSISTGIAFFDHMLDQLARHGMIDLNLTCKGDLHVDEHHTIEDTALALGEALALALGDKRGISRYGFFLPMDDCHAQVALDFGGRPALIWKAPFQREKIGSMPTEMFSHFFKSLSDAARCNIAVLAEGENEHHKIEAIFKAFARALRMAVERDERGILPTTKGIL